MEKINQKEMDKRVAKLKSYIKKNGHLKVAALCGYDDTAPIKMWIKRRSIPTFVWDRLSRLLEEKVDVKIQVI